MEESKYSLGGCYIYSSLFKDMPILACQLPFMKWNFSACYLSVCATHWVHNYSPALHSNHFAIAYQSHCAAELDEPTSYVFGEMSPNFTFTRDKLSEFMVQAAELVRQNESRQFGPLQQLGAARTALRFGRQASKTPLFYSRQLFRSKFFSQTFLFFYIYSNIVLITCIKCNLRVSVCEASKGLRPSCLIEFFFGLTLIDVDTGYTDMTSVCLGSVTSPSPQASFWRQMLANLQ